MVRTRDLVILVLSVIALSLVIAVTWFSQRDSGSSESNQVVLNEVTDKEYSAGTPDSEELSREERLAEMKRRVAESEGKQVAVTETEIELDPVITEASTTDEQVSEEVAVGGLQQCVNYQAYAGIWPVNGLQTDVVEGSRVYFLEIVSEYELSDTATSGVTLPPDTSRDVRLQLPLGVSPAANPSCIGSDVVGVAKEGSLIRNKEAGLYGVFDSDTLIGYALDGVPIYGASDTRLDACGGTVGEDNQYRYHLSSDRETVINCFSAPPVKL